MRQDRMQWSYPRNLSALLLSVFMLATLPAARQSGWGTYDNQDERR
jgi:hypothetical protein